MALIHPAKKLSNPFRDGPSASGRWHIVVSPLMHEDFVPKRGKFRTGELEELLEEINADSKNPNIARALSLYREYNELFIKKVPKIRNRQLIVTTEMSINRTNPENIDVHPAYFGTDPFTIYNTLSTKILKLGNELYKENPKKFIENIEQKILFLPMGPIPFPYEFLVKNDEVIIQHALPEAIEGINEKFSGKGKLHFGTIQKSLNSAGQITNYEWSDLQLMADSVKKVDIGMEQRLVEKVCYLNLLELTDAYDNILERLGTDEFYRYATESSYVSKVCKRFPEKKYKINNFGLIMRDGKMSREKECKSSALGILKGALKITGGYLE